MGKGRPVGFRLSTKTRAHMSAIRKGKRGRKGVSVSHGHSAGGTSPTYHSWQSMLQRCTNTSHMNYPRYGGRGIKVCAEWVFFENFLADMGVRPVGVTLDRIDVDGNYEPGNCRWATPEEQSANTRRSKASSRQQSPPAVGQDPESIHPLSVDRRKD